MNLASSPASEILLLELEKRKKRNAKYSLRSFARLLKISPSHLSAVLTGKRKLTLSLASQLAERLGFSEDDQLALLRSLAPGLARTAPEIETRRLSEDEFSVIADWYHYGILGLASLEINAADPQWISKKLGISEEVALEALIRLRRLGLIEFTKTGAFRQSCKPIRTSQDVMSSAIRQYHKRNLELAASKLEQVDVTRREFGAMTVTMDPARVSKGKKLIREFLERMSSELEHGGRKTSVYTVSVQLFPLTRDEGN